MHWRVQWHESLPSTNTYLRELLVREPYLAAGAIVATTHKTAGRGRHDRTWAGAPGRDLAASIVLRERVSQECLPILPMAAALAVRAALVGLGVDAQVKWPNDVLVKGQKICGILAEVAPAHTRTRTNTDKHGHKKRDHGTGVREEPTVNRSPSTVHAPQAQAGSPGNVDAGSCHASQSPPTSPPEISNHKAQPSPPPQTVVLGIGLNVNMPHQDAQRIQPPATSLAIETAQLHDPAEVLGRVLDALQEILPVWRTHGFPGLRAQWMAAVHGLGQPVTVRSPAFERTGILVGFDDAGQLRLRDAAGEEHTISAGEVL